jgi:thymidylate synthase (FAD)
VIFTFHVKMPVFVARQWVRHRTARMNEISGRYSVMTGEFYVPEPDDVQFQSERNKQGRSADEVPAGLKSEVLRILKENNDRSFGDYMAMIGKQVSRELARVVLPLGLYTQMYWQIDLRNLLHFIRLRADAHAQKEIREYAECMGGIVRAVAPLAWEAFEEYVLKSVTLSRTQAARITEALAGVNDGLLRELNLIK